MRRAHKRRQGELKNARFWYYWNGGFVRITLAPGQTVTLHESHPTDEGYSYQVEEFCHEEDRILLRWESGGRDCDGVTSQSGKSAADLDKLAVRPWTPPTNITGGLRDGTVQPIGIMLPEWREAGRTRVYDQFAQMAGY